MKAIKGKTTFEFTDKEVELLNDCYAILDEIYGSMTEEETFCDYTDSMLENNVLTFLRHMTCQISPNGIITCK